MVRFFRQILAGIMLAITLSTPTDASTLSAQPLTDQANDFLELLDQGSYTEAWLEISSLGQLLKNQDEWQDHLQAIRDAYGNLTLRQLDRISYRESYSRSPDGQYVIIQFTTNFQHKIATTETVVLDCSNAPDCSVREYIIY